MVQITVEDVSMSYPVYGLSAEPKRAATPAAKVGAATIADSGTMFGGKIVKALESVSFCLKRGDRLGVIGRNGSGKSTLLRVLSGIYEPDQGRVLIEGRISAVLDIGLGMRAEASGYQNIKLRLLATGYSGGDIDQLAVRIAEFTELGDFVHMPVRTYSRGMLTRLAFATATAMKPEILVLDEWIGAGDRTFQAKAQQHMRDFVGSAGIVVIASHSAPLIRNVCNRALWIDRGTMQCFGEVDEVVRAYEASA